MAAQKTRPESVIQLPATKLHQMNGFALDFGGSVVKIAYLSREDWEHGDPTFGGFGKIRLISFAGPEFDEALEFLKKNCYIQRTSGDDKPLMFTCGVGASQFGPRIEKELHIITQILSEMDCFQASLKYYLQHEPLHEFCVQFPEEFYERIKNEVKERRMLMSNMGKGVINMKQKGNLSDIFDQQYGPGAASVKQYGPGAAPVKQYGPGAAPVKQYGPGAAAVKPPYLFATCGSGMGVIRVDEDGSYFVVNLSRFAGKSFLGLGSLLTGAKTYDELMALAEKGDNLKLDVSTQMIAPRKPEEKKSEKDPYNLLSEMDPRPIYLWGQADGRDLSEFSREDVARSMLYTVCQVVAGVCFDSCIMTGIRHLFLVGSLVSHPLTQSLVLEEFEDRKWNGATCMSNVDPDYHLHIVQNASHMGAIGALLH